MEYNLGVSTIHYPTGRETTWTCREPLPGPGLAFQASDIDFGCPSGFGIRQVAEQPQRPFPPPPAVAVNVDKNVKDLRHFFFPLP